MIEDLFFVLLALLGVLAVPIAIIVLFVRVAGLKARIALLEARLRATPGVETAAAPAADLATNAATASDQGIPGPWSAGAAKKDAPAAKPPMSESAAPQGGAVMASAGAVAGLSAVSPVLPDAGQDRPLVLRRDRMVALFAWLHDNWVYAISATSLALAGMFFVQYGMERGLLPPGLRVLCALVFGGGLVAAGEWLRRRHGDAGVGSTAFLPSVFSGAGIVTLLAAVLAARQLYGLIGPGAAFAGLLATASVSLVIGWLSGPLLVAVGLLGAAAAPFVVGGNSDSVDWLFGYFALIAALGLGVDALRRWAWVSVLALVLGYGGGFIVYAGGGNEAGWIAQLLVLFLLAATVPELRPIPSQAGPPSLPALALRGASGWPIFPVRLALGAMIATTLGIWVLTLGAPAGQFMLAMVALAGLVVFVLVWAEKAEGLADLALLPTFGFQAALAMTHYDNSSYSFSFSSYSAFAATALDQRPPETDPSLIATIYFGLGVAMTLAFAYRALRPGSWGLPFALAAVLTAPMTATWLEFLWQPAAVLGPFVWALHLLALAGLMTLLAQRFARADAPDLRRAAYAILAALSLVALALFLLTTKTALTLALAVLVVVAAALDRRLRLPEMSLFLQIGTAALTYRLLIDPGLFWALEAERWPVILAYGGTIAAMIGALTLMRPLDRPLAKSVAESAAAGLAAVLVDVLWARWLISDGTWLPIHLFLTLFAMPWLILMLVQLYRARLGGALTRLRQLIAAVAGAIAAMLLVAASVFGNPLISWGPKNADGLVRGPYLLDSLFVAYAAPGLMLLLASRRLPGLHRWLKFGFAAFGAALVLLYLGLEIRRFWQGDWLGIAGVVQAELYSYTLAMMLLGAGLLYQSIAKRSDPLRRLGMAVIGLTVAKVFLLDAAGLTGLTRVASFAGLGLSLAGLAWLNRWAERLGGPGEGTDGPRR